MIRTKNQFISRRDFIKSSAIATVGFSVAPFLNCNKIGVEQPLKRAFGRLDFEVTTFGLGGQSSLQWTPSDVDPIKIILKAFELGINYFDTSNVYGPSQLNYGKAFRELNLIPGQVGYNESLRRSIFLTSKTGLRWGNRGITQDGIRSFSNGPKGSGAIDDLKRTLSQIFGDGQGNYPSGSYVDMVLIHALNSVEEIEAVYQGLDDPDPSAERIGALVSLLDYRDGTNRTGLNPKEEKLIKHIGFSGHRSPPVMMEMIQRDKHNILDAMLVAINANDRLNFNMQHNAIPVASEKNMGIIAMKVFADGAMYSKDATWSRAPEHVVRSVGSPTMSSRPLVEYALTTTGIHTAIIGIGQINNDPNKCQLKQNISAAQIQPDGLSESDRLEIEKNASTIKDGRTNYFQLAAENLSPPNEPLIMQELRDDQRVVKLTWQTAYAGREPIQNYEIWRDNQKIGQVQHIPQTSKEPFAFEDNLNDKDTHEYKILTVDRSGNDAPTEKLIVSTM